ncbi:hypothetical protein A8L44_07430 [Bacillus sp. FJAT-27986]|nr:hypothetical protein A8L44_07430 [Bacillus sp. FJAT-27986]
MKPIPVLVKRTITIVAYVSIKNIGKVIKSINCLLYKAVALLGSRHIITEVKKDIPYRNLSEFTIL